MECYDVNVFSVKRAGCKPLAPRSSVAAGDFKRGSPQGCFHLSLSTRRRKADCPGEACGGQAPAPSAAVSAECRASGTRVPPARIEQSKLRYVYRQGGRRARGQSGFVRSASPMTSPTGAVAFRVVGERETCRVCPYFRAERSGDRRPYPRKPPLNVPDNADSSASRVQLSYNYRSCSRLCSRDCGQKSSEQQLQSMGLAQKNSTLAGKLGNP
jgi:hypothetical protein